MNKKMSKKYAKVYKGKTYYGGGVILYNGSKILMQKSENKNYWEDFGGRTDEEDKDVIYSAFREAKEESNGILTHSYLKRLVKNNPNKCYPLKQNNSYFIYMIYVDREEKSKLKPERFGDYEFHDDIPRIVEWVERDVKLHPRIIGL